MRHRDRPGLTLTDETHHEVAITGAGFSGLGMAMALKQDGIDANLAIAVVLGR